MAGSSLEVHRTLAILRGQCAQEEARRRSVEARITESGFDILDERYVDGEEGLLAGPAVVLVLQRTRAVNVWLNIVNSTREEYGEDLSGCPSAEAAESMLTVLFPDLDKPLALPEDAPADLSAANLKAATLSPPATNDERSVLSSAKSSDSQPSFRARDLPATHAQPDIAPRMSRAAMLRMGMSPPPPSARRPSSTTQSSEASHVTPGVTQRLLAEADRPKSIAAPAIAPRPTKASALRTGQDGAATDRPPPARRASSGTSGRSESADFSHTPGHRRQSLQIAVASVKAPSIAPRPTKASALRAGGGDATSSPAPAARERVALGTAERARPAGTEFTPGYKRQSLQCAVASTRAPVVAPRPTKASALRQGTRPASAMAKLEEREETSRAESPIPPTFAGVPGHKRPEAIKVTSTSRAPTITPRANKSATLRAKVGGADPNRTPLKAAF